jgi:hypothetical protein
MSEKVHHSNIDNFKGKEKKNWSRFPDGGLTPGQTGCMTIGHEIIMTLTLSRLMLAKSNIWWYD